MKKNMMRTASFALLIMLIGLQVSLQSGFGNAASDDKIYVEKNDWDYIQLKISKDNLLKISLSSDDAFSALVFTEDNFEYFQDSEDKTLAKVENGNSNGAVTEFDFEYDVSEDTILYIVVFNDNADRIGINYHYEFEGPTIDGFSVITMLLVSIPILLIIARKARKRS